MPILKRDGSQFSFGGKPPKPISAKDLVLHNFEPEEIQAPEISDLPPLIEETVKESVPEVPSAIEEIIKIKEPELPPIPEPTPEHIKPIKVEATNDKNVILIHCLRKKDQSRALLEGELIKFGDLGCVFSIQESVEKGDILYAKSHKNGKAVDHIRFRWWKVKNVVENKVYCVVSETNPGF